MTRKLSTRHYPRLLMLGVIFLIFLPAATPCLGQDAPTLRIASTHRDVVYGPDERNILDFWQVQSGTPTPLVIFIHGGGWDHGSKENIYQPHHSPTLNALLAAGISVAAINYRFVTAHPLPAAHHDARRALQFLRRKAETWNLDKSQVGAFGRSAGAQLAMWLAFHDEMADPESADPVARESTRLACVATDVGQTTMDFRWWEEWIPEFAAKDFHRWPPGQPFGEKTGIELENVVRDISALDIVSVDDPPIYMRYEGHPTDPVPDRGADNWKTHHVVFGIKLKKKMDQLGVEANLCYPRGECEYATMADFFRVKLAQNAERGVRSTGQAH